MAGEPATRQYLTDGTTLNSTITLSKATGTKVALDTDHKYLDKDIELTINAPTTQITTNGLTVNYGDGWINAGSTTLTDNNLTASNIKNGITIFGITGNYTGEGLLITESLDSHGGTIANITATNSLMLLTKTITPTNSVLIITPDEGYHALTEVTIDAAPLASWLGADPTLIKTCTSRNIALKDLPTFDDWDRSSTTAKVLRASPSTDCDTFIANFDNYEYIIILQMEVDFVYTNEPETAIKGKAIREVYQNIQFLALRPSVTTNDPIEASNFNTAVCHSYLSGLHHYTTNAAGTIAVYSYLPNAGIYLSNLSSTFSSATVTNPTVTIREPIIYGKCSASYLATAHAQLLNTTNTKVKLTGKVYRVNKSTNWKRGEYESLLALYHNGGGT